MSLKILKNDYGIAWGLAAAFMLIVLGGWYLIFNLPIFNAFITPLNAFQAQGMLSSQTSDAATFGVNIVQFMSVILLFGIFAWVVVRAHERRGQ